MVKFSAITGKNDRKVGTNQMQYSVKDKPSFFELLNNETIYYNEFEEYQKVALDYLHEQECITIDKYNSIKWFNKNKIAVMKLLFYSGVISFYRTSVDMQIEIKK